MPSSKPRIAEVVDLAKIRANTRLVACRKRIARAQETNKRALTRLFNAGLLFTKEGTRIGRDLLLAYQQLLRVEALLVRLSDANAPASKANAGKLAATFRELEAVLERTSALTHRTGEWLDALRSE
ncbi:MAG: hypothetical protein IRZ16_16165 [Myxococcaceae bacterium]|nr:hypothetical protein [Myxococcaceae bacterium]